MAAGTAVGGIREEVGTLPVAERLTGIAGCPSGRYALAVVTVLSCTTLDAAGSAVSRIFVKVYALVITQLCSRGVIASGHNSRGDWETCSI